MKLRIVINYIILRFVITNYIIMTSVVDILRVYYIFRKLYFIFEGERIACSSVSVDLSAIRTRQSANLFSPSIADTIMFKHKNYETEFYIDTYHFLTLSTLHFQNLNNVHSTRTILYECTGA